MNILIVTTAYPPINVSGSIRALYYSNYLSQLGHKVFILTTDVPKDFSNYDKTLIDKISSKVIVNRANMGVLFNKTYTKKNVLENVLDNNTKSSSQRLKSVIKNFIAIPDSYLGWRRKAIKLGKQLIKEKNIDVILSMHESPSSHLVAKSLKKAYSDVKLVGYWSDPWSVNLNEKSKRFFRDRIEFLMESKVIKYTDKYLFTTEETRDLYINKFNIEKDKVDIVYRGYDKNLYSSNINIPKEIEKNKFNIVHAGEIFTNIRDVNPFLEALYELKNNNVEIYKKLNVILLGGIDNVKKIIPVDNLECLTILPRKPFKEAIEYINSSQALLIWGNKNSCQLPGKAYDYLGAQNCIISILGDDKDPLKNFMINVNKGPILKNDKNTIANSLKKIMLNGLNKEWNKSIEKYEWYKVVEDLNNKMLN